jgi:molybdate transport system substrate-binding protein
MVLKVMCSNAMRTVFNAVAARFGEASSARIDVEFIGTKRMLEKAAAGARADLYIMNIEGIDELIGLGAVQSHSRHELATSSVGVAVREGTPHPQIATVEDFKRMLLGAKSVAFSESGASGIHCARVIAQLGIEDAVRAKATIPGGGLVAELVASGKVEVAIQQISELLAVQGIELVGPLPTELQSTSVIAAGVGRDAGNAGAAQRLVASLADPALAEVYRAAGLIPHFAESKWQA